jgi:dipeptidase
MEIMSKGPGHKGAVWVATRIPDGYISGHANQCRTTKIDFNDKENVLHSADVVTFAQAQGLYPKDGE